MLALFGIRVLAAGLATMLIALPAPREKQYRVDGLIENGFLGDPKGWRLEGLRVEEGKWVSRKGAGGRQGVASTTFLGPDGYYRVRIHYLDEGDGVSQAVLKVGERRVGRWEFDGILVDRFRWQEFDGVRIHKGEALSIEGRKGHYEYCRRLGVEILPSVKPKRGGAQTRVPEVEFSSDLVPLGEGRGFPASEEFVAPVQMPMSGGPGTYLLYLRSGQRFHPASWPNYTGYRSTLRYSLARRGENEPLRSGTFRASSNHPIHLPLQAQEEGVYELKVEAVRDVRGSVQVRLTVSHVRRVPATGRGFLYVPPGTEAVGVRMQGHAVVLDASGRVMLDHWLDGEAMSRVDVPEDSDGQLWFFQGELQEVSGVHPYVTRRPEAMLVPRETLE